MKGIDELLKRKGKIIGVLWEDLKTRKHTDNEIKEELEQLDEDIHNLIVTYNELVAYQNGNALEIHNLVGKLSNYGKRVGVGYYVSVEKEKEIRDKDREI